MVDVSKQIIAQFAANLAKIIDVPKASRSTATEQEATETAVRDEMRAIATPAPSASTPSPISNEPLDLSSVALGPLLKRAVFVLIAVCLISYLIWKLF
jgi:hypothetical protein